MPSARSLTSGKTRSTPTKAKPRTEQADTVDTQTTPDSLVSEQARHDIRLSFLMHDVSRMRRSAYDQRMKPLGITRAQWWVLAHLSRHDGMMQTQLADVLEVGKASLGDVIESLEANGWVTRRTGPTDKRAKRVYLTRPSQGLIKRMTMLEVQFNDHVFADLTEAERTAMASSLIKIKHALARMSEAGNPLSQNTPKP